MVGKAISFPMIRRFLTWLALEAPYAPLRPYVLGLAIGRWPHRSEWPPIKATSPSDEPKGSEGR